MHTRVVTHLRHRTRRRALALIVGASLAVVVAGCAGGDDHGGSSTLATPPPSATVPAPTGATATVPTTATPSATTPATGAPATGETTEPGGLANADINAITDVFGRFFGGQATTVDEKVAVLEDGEIYREMLEGASANEQFQQMTINVRDVRAGTADECTGLGADAGCAVVLHDLLVGGFPMAMSIQSPAIQRDGKWLVGARAWCNVVEIGGASCPGANTEDSAAP